MEKEKPPRFIVIDDDLVNNMLCKRVIKKSFTDADLIIFDDPETGLAYILGAYGKPGAGKAILFLDINMPTMTGWEFMEKFKKAGTVIKEQVSVYILSSSVNPSDKDKASHNPDIVGYIEKPLTLNAVQSLSAIPSAIH